MQIAVLEPVGHGAGAGFQCSRPILVEDFVAWLGLVTA